MSDTSADSDPDTAPCLVDDLTARRKRLIKEVDSNSDDELSRNVRQKYGIPSDLEGEEYQGSTYSSSNVSDISLDGASHVEENIESEPERDDSPTSDAIQETFVPDGRQDENTVDGVNEPNESDPRLDKNSDDEMESKSTLATSLNISNLSFSKLTGQFKKPNAPPKKRLLKPSFVCGTCGKGYVSSSYFKTHVLTHQVQEAASRFPDEANIIKNALQIGGAALEKVKEASSGEPQGLVFKSLVNKISKIVNSDGWRKFVESVGQLLMESVRDHKFLLPSKLLSVLVDRADDILFSAEKQRYVLNFLELTPIFKNSIKSQFLLEFILCFLEEILSFISSRICATEKTEKDDNIDLDDEEKEVIYYIAGSIMRGYFRIAFRHQNNSKWKSILNNIKTHILTDQPVGYSSWTLSLDGGGLLYVTKECREFFEGLTKIVYKSEQKDGSINYSQVINIVCQGHLSILWGKMFDDSLSEDMCLNFMNNVIESFCKTCGRGFAKKRLNNLRK